MAHELAVAGGVAEAPPPAHGRAHAAAGAVGAGGVLGLAADAQELVGVEVLGRLEAEVQPVPGRTPPGLARLVELDARTVGQVPDGVREVESLALLDVVEDVTALAATEAVPEAGVRLDVKRRRLLVVEGAAAPEVPRRALAQLDGLPHQGHEIGGLAHALALVVADHAPPSRGSRQRGPSNLTGASPRRRRTCSMLPRTTDLRSPTSPNLRDALSSSVSMTSTAAP